MKALVAPDLSSLRTDPMVGLFRSCVYLQPGVPEPSLTK